MGRKAPLDPCIFCGNLPCTCGRPSKTGPARVKRDPAPKMVVPVAPVVPLDPMVAARARYAARPIATVAAPVSPVGASAPVGIENRTPGDIQPATGDTALEEYAIFLLESKLGAKVIGKMYTSDNDPAAQVKAVRQRYG